jgi:hypothetical protein
MGADGTRRTSYYISGTDWGYVFNNTMYVDPTIAAAGDTGTQGNLLYVQLRELFLNEKGVQNLSTNDVIGGLVKIFGFGKKINEISSMAGRLGKPIFDIKLPKQMSDFLKIKNGQSLMANLDIKIGALQSYNKYTPVTEALSIAPALSLQGQFTLWQVILDNCNPPLNEVFCDMDWEENDEIPKFVLYKRIKPFCLKNTKYSGPLAKLRSYFENVKTHTIEPVSVISINLGNNWRDKINYVQIRFETQDLRFLDNEIKKNLEQFDPVAFEREGFRPLIETTRQLPIIPQEGNDVKKVIPTPEFAKGWVNLLSEWYFDTHRMLNGTINLVGSVDYISVGNNIKFDLDLVSTSDNLNLADSNNKKLYILAHIESVSHSFTIDQSSGARSYTTSVQFTRGSVIDENNVFADYALDAKIDDSWINNKSQNHITTTRVISPDYSSKK